MDSSEREHGPAIQRIFLEFQAGKMTMDEKQVVPDPRKGLVRVGKDEEGLVHVMWLDLKSDGIEDDQIVFPEEATYEKVGPPSARAYILKFRTDDRKLFFWMQERNAEGDSEICTSVNFYINQPLEFPDEEEEPAAPVTLQHHEAIAEDDISSRAGNLAGPIIGAEVAGNITASGPVKMSDLQRILSNIGSSGEAVDPDAGIGLGDILKPELIFPLFETLRLEQQLESYLPEGHWTPEELMELVQSPPFRQQLDSFTYVLRTGQIDLTQFGIDPSKYKFTVPSFLEALEDSVSKSSETGESQTYKQTDRMDEGQ